MKKSQKSLTTRISLINFVHRNSNDANTLHKNNKKSSIKNFIKMKRIIFLLMLAFTINATFAQRNHRTTAFNYLRSGRLDQAKEYIDKTVLHPQTINDARAWFYKGNIYLSIDMSNNPEYKNLAPDALDVALTSYKKALEFDVRKEYFADILTNLIIIGERFYNKGVDLFNANKFMEASNAFYSSAQLSRDFGSLDTTALFNAATTADIGQINHKAKEIYNELITLNYNNPAIFTGIGGIYLREGDTISALNYIQQGREKFPDDYNVLIHETNIFLLTNKVPDALANLQLAMTKDETNPTLFFAIGVTYDQLRNLNPENAAEYLIQAETAYLSAIRLDNNYFDALYNLGALYVNQAAQIIEAANEIPLREIERYNKEKERAHELLAKSLPHLELAHKIQPGDLSTMVSLKEIYTRLGMYDKLKIMNEYIHVHASSNINYNFEPIEVDVKQDAVQTAQTRIESKDITVGKSDVSVNIPVNPQTNDKTFVLIFANENYRREARVPFAINDGSVFKEYCEKTLGIPSINIRFLQDATFGEMRSGIGWLTQVMAAFKGEAKVIFYYAGHGMPDEMDRTAYLLPTDGFSSDYQTAIKLDYLFERLSQQPAQSITVFLDACFSGAGRDDMMLAAESGQRAVRLRPREGTLKGNMVVFSAATGDETAFPYKEKQHGLFTYFLLQKLQQTKGNVTLYELSNHVISNVSRQSILINSKSQTPQVNVAPELQESWKNIKLK